NEDMPILPPEQSLFPETLFAEPKPAQAEGQQWWVLHTKPRQEKSLIRSLCGQEVCCYLPLVERRLQVRRQVLTSLVPLFPGYVFLLGGRDDRLAAVTTGRVVRSLEVPDQEELWNDLRQIHRLLGCGAPILPEARLTPGTRV